MRQTIIRQPGLDSPRRDCGPQIVQALAVFATDVSIEAE